MSNLLPSLFGAVPLLIAILLTSCSGGGGAEVTVSQTVTQNNDSQNGDTECKFECEPVELAGQAGFAVTQICNGNVANGPNFLQSAPVGCAFTAAAEGEVAQVEQAVVSVGLNQDGTL